MNTVSNKASRFKARASRSRNLPLSATHARTRSTASGQTSGARSAARGVFKGPQFFGGR